MSQAGDRVGAYALTERLELEAGVALWLAERADGRVKGAAQAVVRLAADPNDRVATDALRAEYNALRAVSDPHFPAVLSFHDGQHALVTAPVEGISLREAMLEAETGRLTLSPATALDITLEVAQALRAAHSAPPSGFVHGWFSADEVWLTLAGDVMLMGLGQPPPLGARRAPEHQADARSDQWLLGALLAELLLETPLWADLPPGGDPQRHLDRRLKTLDRRWPEAARLVRKALDPSPDRRFPQDVELLRALHELARHEGGSSSRLTLVEQVLELRAAALRQDEAEDNQDDDAEDEPISDEPAPSALPSSELESPEEDDATDELEAPALPPAAPPAPRLPPSSTLEAVPIRSGMVPARDNVSEERPTLAPVPEHTAVSVERPTLLPEMTDEQAEAAQEAADPRQAETQRSERLAGIAVGVFAVVGLIAVLWVLFT
ncbi:hypothetical protein L6R49_26290 [Myxococcota bacterium]|nr:hypothetical protein [Myxococcota bacterium]